jgi:enamine deaminase RidA (YjgF/YER057c/UK114 family)
MPCLEFPAPPSANGYRHVVVAPGSRVVHTSGQVAIDPGLLIEIEAVAAVPA